MTNLLLRCALLLASSLVFSSCQRTNLIPDESVVAYVKSQLPAFVSIKQISLDRTPVSSTSEDFSFKVEASPRELLYTEFSFDEVGKELIAKGLRPEQSERSGFGNDKYDYRGIDRLVFLKPVNLPSETLSIYGTVSARKIMDKVEFGRIAITSGTQSLGRPKSSFPPGSISIDNAEYQQKLAGVLAQQKSEEEKQNAAEEAKKTATEQRKQQLLTATKPGSRYRGTWTQKASSKEIALEFVDQKMDGRILKARFTLPEDPNQELEYEGYIDYSDVPKEGPILLHLVRGKSVDADWGENYSNLNRNSASVALELLNGKLFQHSSSESTIRVDLEPDDSLAGTTSPVSGQSEIDQIRAQTQNISRQLQKTGLSEADKNKLRQNAARLATRLDELLRAKKNAQ